MPAEDGRLVQWGVEQLEVLLDHYGQDIDGHGPVVDAEVI